MVLNGALYFKIVSPILVNSEGMSPAYTVMHSQGLNNLGAGHSRLQN